MEDGGWRTGATVARMDEITCAPGQKPAENAKDSLVGRARQGLEGSAFPGRAAEPGNEGKPGATQARIDEITCAPC